MIKNTLDVLKKNPILFAFMVIIFAYDAAAARATGLISQILYDNIEDFYNIAMLSGVVYNLWSIVCKVISVLFIYGPMLYLMYLASSNQDKKGWYIKGLKRNWWRYLIAVLAMGALNGIITIIINFVGLITGLISYENPNFMVMALSVISGICGYIMYLIIAPLTVEDNFWQGFGKIFSVGKKYFWKLLIVYAVYYLITMLIPGIKTGAFLLTFAFKAIAAVIMYALSVNMYVTERQNIEKQVETDAEETENND